jgi:hypothetical protein
MPDAARPYRCPGYPWVPALYALLPVIILGNMLSSPSSTREAAIGLGFIGLGVLTYFALGLNRNAPPPVVYSSVDAISR